MIHVIATIELNPGKRDQFLKVFHALMPKVQAEAGCIEYGPAVDLNTGISVQMPQRDNTVTIIEKWQDLPALKKHLAQTHMSEYRTQVKEFVKGVQLQVLQPA
jgi:quinol monooxygenase YgiN